MNRSDGAKTIDPSSDSFRPVLVDGLKIRRVENESIIWSAAQPFPTYVDPVSTLLMSVFDGLATRADLIVDVVEALNVSRDEADSWLDVVFRTLISAGALEPSSKPSPGSEPIEHLLPEPNW